MCGIFGYAKQQNAQNDNQIEMLRDVLTYLADESVIRGTDSTGISMISPSNRRTFKATAPSSEVVSHEAWKSNILDRVDRDSTIAIGHVRLATHGSVTKRNAHPFEIGEVIGAHNGVIYNYNKLAEKYNKSIEVDSEIIFASLNLHSMEKALEELEGDYAVSWIKESNKILHLARESSRPLCVAYWKKARVLLWASTEDIMNRSLKRAGLSLKYVNLKSEVIYTFDTDKFDNKSNPTRDKFEAKDKPIYSSTATTLGVHGLSSWTDTYYDDYYGVGDVKKEIKCEMCTKKFPRDGVIEVEYDTHVCLDCYEEIDCCDWCGDYMLYIEAENFHQWRVCNGCKPDVDNQLMLTESSNCNLPN